MYKLHLFSLLISAMSLAVACDDEGSQPPVGSAGETADEGAGASAGTPAGESAGEPSGESAGEPSGESAGEPSGESAGEPSGESAGEPAGESAGEPAGESAGEPAGESAGEPAGESAGEPAGESAGEPAGESAGAEAGSIVGEVRSEVASCDECDTHASCERGVTSSWCVCQPGYEGDGQTCDPIDQCEGLMCPPESACTTTDGRARCVCPPGQTLAVTPNALPVCAYVASCDLPNQHPCFERQVCTLEAGQPTCACPEGWEPNEIQGCVRDCEARGDCPLDTPPEVTILTPEPSAQITGYTTLEFTVDTDAPYRWRARIWVSGQMTPHVIREGDEQGDGQADLQGTIDALNMPSGPAELEVEVWAAGGYTQARRSINLNGPVMSRAHRLTVPLFRDLTLDGTRLPLSLAYHSELIADDELAPGWRWSLPGELVLSPELTGPSLTEGHRVYIRGPQGDWLGFSFTPRQITTLPPTYQPVFQPDANHDYQLIEESEGDLVRSGGSYFQNFTSPYTTNQLTLLASDGVRYHLNRTSGLTGVSAEGRGVIEYNADVGSGDEGWRGASGQTLVITRDEQARPVAISLYEVTPNAPDAQPTSTATLSYDDEGSLTAVTDASEVTTRFAYQLTHNPRLVTQVTRDGRHDELLYTRSGSALAHCPAGSNSDSLRGCETRLYDADSRRWIYISGPSRAVEYTYNEQGMMTSWRLRRGYEGELLEEHDYQYNEDGQLTERSRRGEVISSSSHEVTRDEEVARTRFELNTAGQLLAARDEDGRQLIRFDWDERCGLPTRSCDRADLCDELTYNDQCQLVERRAPDDSVERYQYVDGALAQVEDAAGQIWSFAREEGGVRMVYTSPTGHEIRRVYDDRGRLITLERGDSAIAYTYDPQGRLSSLTAGDERITLEYNAQGRLNYAEGPDGAVAFNWSASGLPRSVYYTGDEGEEPLSLHYTSPDPGARLRERWQPATVSDSLGGRITQQIGPNQLPIHLSLEDGLEDEEELIEAHIAWSAEARLAQWVGQRMGQRVGQGATEDAESISADFTYRCASCKTPRLVSYQRESGASLLELDYEYGAGDQLTRWRIDESAREFTYDERGRLTSAARDATITELYEYDVIGGWTESHHSGSYQYGWGDASGGMVVGDDQHTYYYAPDGQLTERASMSGERVTLSYSPWGQVREIITSQDDVVTQTIRFQYSPLGDRIGVTINGERWRILPDRKNPYLVIGPQGERYRRLFLPGLDYPIAERRVMTSSDGEVSAQTRWLLTDHLGSVRRVVDDQGQVTAQYDYESYGAPLGDAPAWPELGYVGRPTLPGLGWVDMRARLYDPLLGSFLAPDARQPWGYRYAEGDPLRFRDPEGRSAIGYAWLAKLNIIGVLCTVLTVTASFQTSLDPHESKHMGAQLLFYVADHLEGVNRHTSGTGELSDTPFPDLSPSFADNVNTFLGPALCTLGLFTGALALGL